MKPRKTITSVPPSSCTRAEVLSVVDPDTVLVRFGKHAAEDMMQATVAVPLYVPRVGDRVIVSLGGDEVLVLGVLGDARRRAQPVTLCEGLEARRNSDGMVELFATDGPLTIGALHGVRIAAAEVSVVAERVDVSADRLVETTGSMYVQAEDLAQTTAKRVRTIVDETCEIQAKRTVIASDDDTVIDGKRVLLG